MNSCNPFGACGVFYYMIPLLERCSRDVAPALRKIPARVRLSRRVTPLLLLVALIFLASAIDAKERSETTIDIPADGTSMPMLDIGGRPVVQVRINGRGPFPFILDTGATGTVVDSALSTELALPSSAEGTRLEELVLGSARIRNLAATAAPISAMFGKIDDPPRGVLSALAFPGYLVTFDYRRKQITWRKGALPEPNGKTITAYADDAMLPTVPLKVAGRELNVHLDTGAPFAISLPTKYKDEVPLTAPAEEKGKARSHSGEFPVFKATVDGEVTVGEFELPREVVFTDVLPHGGAIPQGQIGYGALREFAVTLDSTNRRIEFVKAAAEASAGR